VGKDNTVDAVIIEDPTENPPSRRYDFIIYYL
jgi:hypothetical protein